MMGSMSKERGTSPEYPDIPPLYPSYYPRYDAGGPPHIFCLITGNRAEAEELAQHGEPCSVTIVG